MKSRKRKNFLYSLLIIVAIIAATYFFFTSSFFLSKVFLPVFFKNVWKVDISIKKTDFDIFTSRLSLRDIIVGNRQNPFITAENLDYDINLFSLFDKVMLFELDNIDAKNVNVFFRQAMDETWSIPWLYVNVSPKQKIKFLVDIENINISNMNIFYKQNIDYGKEPLEASMTSLNVYLDHLKNYEQSTIEYTGKIGIKSATTAIRNGGAIAGKTDITLSDWCIPSHINIASTITNIFTGNKYPSPKSRKITFDFNLNRKKGNPQFNEITDFKIKDFFNNKLDSELNAFGHLNFYPFNFKANFNAKPVHAPALRIFTNLIGYCDLGKTADFTYKGGITITSEDFKSNGDLRIKNSIPNLLDFQFTYGIPIDYLFNYDLDINYVKKYLNLNKLFSKITKNSEEVLRISLNKPMPFFFNKEKTTLSSDDPPSLSIVTTDLKLDNFNVLLDKEIKILSGVLNSDINITMDSQDTRNFIIQGVTKTNNGQIDFIEANRLVNLDMSQLINIKLKNFSKILIDNYELDIIQKQLKAANIKVTGEYDLKTKKGKIHTLIPFFNKSLINLYQLIPDSNQKISNLIEKMTNFNIYVDNNMRLDFNNKLKFYEDDLKVILNNTAKDSSITLTLQDNFSFNIKDGDIFLNKDVIFQSDVNNLELAKIMETIPTSFPFKVKRGNFTYDLLFIIPKEMDSIELKGQVALLYSSLSFYNQRIRDLSLTSNINAVIFDTKAVNLIDCYTEVYANGVQCVKAKTNGTLAFNGKDDTNLVITIDSINKYFANIIYDGISVNIDKLNANGKIYCRVAESSNKSYLKGTINIEDAIFGSGPNTNVKGTLFFDLLGTEDVFNIYKLNLLLEKDNNEIAQLNTTGTIPLPLNRDKANITISSERIELDKLIHLYKSLTKPINKTFVSTVNDSALNLEKFKLHGNINLESVTYGDLINSSYYSTIELANSKLALKQKKAEINGTEIKYGGVIETNHNDGFPFNFYVTFNNLDMTPFIHTFVPGENKNVKGSIDSCKLKLKGKGFKRKYLYNNLTGTLNVNLSDLSLPYQIAKNNALKFMLAPIVILEQIREMLPGGFLVQNFEKGIKSTQDILNNLDNIDLKSGVIKLEAKKGEIIFNKVSFLGAPNDTIRYSDFYGSINYGGTINIYSKSNISGLIMPFYLEGTVEKPTPDFAFFIPKFLFLNILTILNPINVLSFTADILIGIFRTIEGLGVGIWDLITYPFTSSDNDKVPDKKDVKKSKSENNETNSKDSSRNKSSDKNNAITDSSPPDKPTDTSPDNHENSSSDKTKDNSSENS